MFNDRKELIHPKIESTYSLLLKNNDKRIVYTILAFIFSELTFYLVWVFIEHSETNFVWLDITTTATLIGISGAMLYNRLPHMSIITLFYSIGFGITIIAILSCSIKIFSCSTSLLTAMSHYCIVGGMYLPFVTEAVINMLGNRNKAIGSALVELGDTVALISAPLLTLLLRRSPINILYLILLLYFAATLLQKRAEKNRTVIIDQSAEPIK